MRNDLKFDVKKLVRGDPHARLRELLENFSIISTRQHMALIPKLPYTSTLRENTKAALVASTLQLSSIDYAKKRYCDIDEKIEETSHDEKNLYIDSYFIAKEHIKTTVSRLTTEGKPNPSAGVFTASVVLERVIHSFFSAHLLYELGNRYDGHAVSRLILEQIAWAYTAFKLNDINKIEKIITTKTISKLKELIPMSGRLYGFLSQKTHIDFSSHLDFLKIENGVNTIQYSHNEYFEYAQILLLLADYFAIVWELTQSEYLPIVESLSENNGEVELDSNRPFITILIRHLETMEKLANEKK